MRWLFALPAGRRAKWVVLGGWLIILAAALPFAGKLFEVTNDNADTYLPGSAESTEALKLQEEFSRGESEAAVVVYERGSGITQADRTLVAQDLRELAAKYPMTEQQQPRESEDGKALLYTVALPADSEKDIGEQLIDGVGDIRGTVGGGADGLEVKVAGPAALDADAVEVYDGLDTTLLLVPVIVVAILLLLIYRSPWLWLVPLVTVFAADQLASAFVYGLAKGPGMTVSSMSAGVLAVLTYGAATDYALLLIARYREELRRHRDKHDAMAAALTGSGPALLASAATVSAGLLCMLLADLNSTSGLGPVGTTGVLCAVLGTLTLLPAILLVFGRRIFWPFVPRYGSPSREAAGLWSRVGRFVAPRARKVWGITAAVLVTLGLGMSVLSTNPDSIFTSKPEAAKGQDVIEAHYPAGSDRTLDIIASADQQDAVTRAAAGTEGVTNVRTVAVENGRVALSAQAAAEPDSSEEREIIDRLRGRVHRVPDANAVVGGLGAVNMDLHRANVRDAFVIIPVVLLALLVILGLLLRSVVAPLLLVGTVILSFGATFGLAALVFEPIYGGLDASLPVLAFVFLVALGIDYNIFLMSRVHEESQRIGTRRGTLTGLAVTGGVITSAGLVLAATFSVLVALPLVQLVELGSIVGFGVLLDALLVRSVLVPALALDLDRWIWWPGRLSRTAVPGPGQVEEDESERVGVSV